MHSFGKAGTQDLQLVFISHCVNGEVERATSLLKAQAVEWLKVRLIPPSGEPMVDGWRMIEAMQSEQLPSQTTLLYFEVLYLEVPYLKVITVSCVLQWWGGTGRHSFSSTVGSGVYARR